MGVLLSDASKTSHKGNGRLVAIQHSREENGADQSIHCECKVCDHPQSDYTIEHFGYDSKVS